MRVHQVFGRQDAVEFRLAQQTAFEHNFAHAFAGLGADFADQIAVAMSDIRVKISNQADGVEHIAFADFAVDGDAFDTFVEIGRASCRERGEISVGAVALKKKKEEEGVGVRKVGK